MKKAGFLLHAVGVCSITFHFPLQVLSFYRFVQETYGGQEVQKQKYLNKERSQHFPISEAASAVRLGPRHVETINALIGQPIGIRLTHLNDSAPYLHKKTQICGEKCRKE